LNIIVKGRWIRPYVRYYIGLVEDDQCSILENTSMSHHFIAREEYLFKIGTVSFECVVTLLHQGVEGGLEDVALVEVGFVVTGISTFYV
jgi:hypothetical protein